MLTSFSKLFIKNNKYFLIPTHVQSYNFILGRMFKKQKVENNEQAEQQAIMQAQLYQAQKKKMKRQVQQQNQYDFLQRQKDIELNKDFRKQREKYKNTIPEGIGKTGFNQLVYWSQNAQTPQQIVDLIKKFNECSHPKLMQDEQTFYQFKENVKTTVYLAQSYSVMVDYAHFGYKYEITEPQFWLKIEQKVVRKPPRNQQQINQLIDIVFVMGNVGQGQIIYSSSQKALSQINFNVQQIAKLIIAYFKTGKGQKEWITSLLVSLQQQIQSITCEIVQSLLPILKQSKNIPDGFNTKIQKKIIQLKQEWTLSFICTVSEYFGYEKGSKELWELLQKQCRKLLSEFKLKKGKIPTISLIELIRGVLTSYKFSTQFVKDIILPELLSKDCKVLYKLSAATLSTLSKCLYIYQLQSTSQTAEQTIQGLIMKKFEKISEVSNQNLIHVLKDYTITRLGSRQFYLFLQSVVNDKLADIKTDKYTIEALTAIYLESNLCSTDTLELLKAIAYE